ncbi:MAG: hypothetical protein GY847_12285 [Proteobacteria bacterium]|nr:hypothetical protein [Pseudomonadota bacterium]
MKQKSPINYEDIHDDIKDKCRTGTYCAHCGQRAQMYTKNLGSPVARFLIRLYRSQQSHERAYLTRELYPRDNKASTEGVIARFWGLIETVDATNSGGAPAGAHKLTNLGKRFVQGLEWLPAYVDVYNNECVMQPYGKLRDIHTALGVKFNYDDLMKGL